MRILVTRQESQYSCIGVMKVPVDCVANSYSRWL